jgi:hypothetical protein
MFRNKARSWRGSRYISIKRTELCPHLRSSHLGSIHFGVVDSEEDDSRPLRRVQAPFRGDPVVGLAGRVGQIGIGMRHLDRSTWVASNFGRVAAGESSWLDTASDPMPEDGGKLTCMSHYGRSTRRAEMGIQSRVWRVDFGHERRTARDSVRFFHTRFITESRPT